MDCQACGRPLTQFDEYRVACKAGHIWTLPEHADKPRTVGDGAESSKPMVRLVKAPRFPAWLPGAVLGGLALAIQVLSLLT